jgi:hypothetical protein
MCGRAGIIRVTSVSKKISNFDKLVVYKIFLIAVPPDGGLNDALGLFLTPGYLGDVAAQATDWAKAAIAAVKESPDNPYGDDDEAIAGEIMRRVGEINSRRKL